MTHLWIHNSNNKLDHMDVVECIGEALQVSICNLGRERAHASIILEQEDVVDLYCALKGWLDL